MNKHILTILLIITIALCRDLYISPTGNDLNEGTKSSPFLSFGKANEIVENGDTIVFTIGIHTASFNISHKIYKLITIIGEDINETVLQGTKKDMFNCKVNVIVSQLTILDTETALILSENGIVTDIVIRNATYGIYSYNGVITQLRGVTFDTCTNGITSASNGELIVKNCHIVNCYNSVYSSGQIRVEWTNNIIEGCGGAIFSKTNFTMIRSTYIGNNRSIQISYSNTIVEDCIFKENNYKGQRIYTAGINLWKGSIDISSTQFINNTGHHAGAVITFEDVQFSIRNCQFIYNKAYNDYSAGAIYCAQGLGFIQDSLFNDNYGTRSDDIYCGSGPCSMYLNNNTYQNSGSWYNCTRFTKQSIIHNQ